MRVALSILTSVLILGLGTATSVVQSQNHALGAHLDDCQRKLELTHMFILDAEATILAAETQPVVCPAAESELSEAPKLAGALEGVQ